MKILKKFLRYILVFIIAVFFLISILTFVAKMPTKYVEKNLVESAEYFKENVGEVIYQIRKREYTYLHPYADQVILNIIYCLDTEHPFKSVLEARYYTNNRLDGNNYKYVELVENDYEGDTEYLRYWHGSIVFIKPLLMLFSLEQIYVVNAIVLSLLTLILFILLFRKNKFEIIISMIIALIMISCRYVPFTFEYVWTFYIMLIVSIIVIIIEAKEGANKKLLDIFFVTGIITCFLDFLTTEILTITVPLVIIISMRFKDKRIVSFKQEFLFVIKSILLWGIGYTAMWLTKWCLSAIFLDIDIVGAVKDSLLTRVNGQVFDYTTTQLMKFSVERNLFILYPLFLIRRKKYILLFILIALIFAFIATFKVKKENFKYAGLMIMLALIPYIRDIGLSNHSYRHAFFVFRNQIPTIMGIVLILVNCANKEKLFAQMKYKKDKGGNS